MAQLATDPPVSEAQRRAMFAAASGHSTLGIPKKVGKEFVGDDKYTKAEADYHAGKRGETHCGICQHFDAPLSCMIVEGLIKPDGGCKFFEPCVDTVDKPASDSFALDREPSNRKYDADGRLHVENTHISKANICPYMGREIPNCEGLGLDANKQYRLYRDPVELHKAAETFNNIPVLSEHVPVSAEHHRPELVEGSTGTDANFDGTYLNNSIVFWAKNAIDEIENEEARQLSCAYRYRADMTPGNFAGEQYDGVMRDIVGNHVARVKEGRAGKDVMVGDSMLESRVDPFDDKWINEIQTLKGATAMDKNVLTRKAAAVEGAVHAFLFGKLAQDETIDLAPVFEGVTADNYSEKVPDVAASISRLARGKLAKDARLDGLREVLLAMDACKPAEAEDWEDDGGDKKKAKDMKRAHDEEDDDEDKKKKDKAEDRHAKDAESETDEEKKVRMDKRAKDKKAWDESDDETDAEKKERMSGRDKKAKDKKMGKDAEKDMPEPGIKAEDMKRAMDEMKISIREEARAEQAALREAERAIRPYVGELAMACDSADDTFAEALKMRGVNVKGVHPSAYPAMLQMLPKAGAAPAQKQNAIAQDSAAQADFAKAHPEVARIRIIG